MSRDDDGRRADDSGRVDRNRRTVLLGAGTALLGGLAGCSGGDGDGDGGDGASDGGDTGGSDGSADTGGSGGDGGSGDGGDGDTDDGGSGEPTRESNGEVATNAIDELEILGWTSEAERDRFEVTVTVENGGGEPTDVTAYTYGVRMWGDGGEEIKSGASILPITAGDEDEISPGDRAQVLLEARPDDASQVARYELSLTCDGTYDGGVYCPE